jgi:hypothetical protein
MKKYFKNLLLALTGAELYESKDVMAAMRGKQISQINQLTIEKAIEIGSSSHIVIDENGKEKELSSYDTAKFLSGKLDKLVDEYASIKIKNKLKDLKFLI